MGRVADFLAVKQAVHLPGGKDFAFAVSPGEGNAVFHVLPQSVGICGHDGFDLLRLPFYKGLA